MAEGRAPLSAALRARSKASQQWTFSEERSSSIHLVKFSSSSCRTATASIETSPRTMHPSIFTSKSSIRGQFMHATHDEGTAMSSSSTTAGACGWLPPRHAKMPLFLGGAIELALSGALPQGGGCDG